MEIGIENSIFNYDTKDDLHSRGNLQTYRTAINLFNCIRETKVPRIF